MQAMRRESSYPMVPIDEAQRIIAAHTAPLASEPIDALSAEGRVLAEDVYAAGPLPDLPKGGVDGYALLAGVGLAARRVLGEITAGSSGQIVLATGTAARIMTGAPLPPGADAVIMVEQTEERDGVVQLRQAVRVGDSVHRVGQDIAPGELVLARGTTIGPAEVGLLAAIGRVQVYAYRRPVVAVLSTGDEVLEPGVALSAGAIRDSNRYALMAAARAAGCTTISLGIARDDAALQRQAIVDGLARADVLLTSGGVSMGTRDLVKPLLAELGTVHFGRIAFKPGKPTTFATIGAAIVFGLPGFPVSSLVSFEVFVRPALRRLQGDAHPDQPRVRVMLADPIVAAPDRPEYQRAIVGWAEGRLVARSTGAQGSSRLLSMRGANALLLVPGDGRSYPAGAELEALLTGPIV
ncbi:MAG: gephyrin-like molybdotransferase Glp [Kouleothrix sp.]